MKVNANAFDYVRKTVQHPLRLRIGFHHLFDSGATGTWYLGNEVMQAAKAYNWNQHTSQVDQWLGSREQILDSLNDYFHRE